MESNTLKHICNEFEIRVFNESFNRIRKSIDLVNEDELWSSPSSIIPSMGELIQHIMGNCTQWICAGICHEKDVRNRNSEFNKNPSKTKIQLSEALIKCEDQLRTCLLNINAEKIERTYSIQGISCSGFSVLSHVIEHTSYHTGQITLLAKWYSNKQTKYYGDMDLNKSID